MEYKEEQLVIYDALFEKIERFERKGKTMPYTSANGYMFSLLNKDGEFGIRLDKKTAAEFKEKHNTTIFMSHGSVMRDYVLVPDNVFHNQDIMVRYLNDSFDFVMSLPPKKK
jgi:hypothetical protein